MANETDEKPRNSPARESELLPAMIAIALAIVAQLALRDGLTLLGAAGLIVAAWLFISSVRAIFDAATREPAPLEMAAREETPEAELAAGQAEDSAGEPANRLAYLRQNWRLLTMAEIFRGDIPPDRLRDLEEIVPLQLEPVVEDAEVAPEADETALNVHESPEEEAPLVGAALVESWAAAAAPQSAPKAVKVTPQGEVLVLDAGLEQVQRYDDAGNLLATYSLAGLAGMELLDLAVSPDGQTLYVVDATSNRLRVINLTEETPAAGPIGESEEE